MHANIYTHIHTNIYTHKQTNKYTSNFSLENDSDSYAPKKIYRRNQKNFVLKVGSSFGWRNLLEEFNIPKENFHK